MKFLKNTTKYIKTYINAILQFIQHPVKMVWQGETAGRGRIKLQGKMLWCDQMARRDNMAGRDKMAGRDNISHFTHIYTSK